MSAFLPEGGPAGGDAYTSPGLGSVPRASDADIQLASRLVSAFLARPQQLLSPLMAYITDAIQVSNLLLPIGQVVGFTDFVSTQVSASINTNNGFSVGAGVTDTQAGPSLSGLTPGKFVVLGGFDKVGLDANTMDLSGGIGSVVDNPRAFAVTLAGTTITTSVTITGAGAGGSIFNLWLLALRYDN